MRTIFSILALLFILGSCSKGKSNDTHSDTFSSLYGGKPFKGSATALLEREGFPDLIWEGDATVALMESSADSVSMVFLGDFGNKSEINFKLRGKMEGSHFRLEGNNSASFFQINDEKITGNLDNDVQKISFGGTMRKERAKMTAHIYFKKASAPFPKGAVLKLELDARRAIVDDGEDGPGCQMRLVPIWGPSGMTMGMVPDC